MKPRERSQANHERVHNRSQARDHSTHNSHAGSSQLQAASVHEVTRSIKAVNQSVRACTLRLEVHERLLRGPDARLHVVLDRLVQRVEVVDVVVHLPVHADMKMVPLRASVREETRACEKYASKNAQEGLKRPRRSEMAGEKGGGGTGGGGMGGSVLPEQ